MIENSKQRNEDFRRILVGNFVIGQAEKDAVNQVLDSGQISEGPKTEEFERKWAEFVGTKHCVATSSGTGALITVFTALKHLLNLNERKKVITSPLTYISDANALALTGFEPVFVDINPETFCIEPEAVSCYLEQVSDPENYSMILPVDLMGYPVKVDAFEKIAQKYNLSVVEDAAEAHGTSYKGHICGSQAIAGIFSFYIAHNIQAGEMGAITTNNYELYQLCKKIKANGRSCACPVCTRANGVCPLLQSYEGKDDFDPRFSHDLIGYNFKTMEFQSALALSQIKNVTDIIKKRRENVCMLNAGLKQFSDVLKLPYYGEDISYLAYPLVIKRPDLISRKFLRKELEENGIETRSLFGCIPTQQLAYEYLKADYKGKLPHAEYIGSNGFYIGCHQYLSKEDIDYVIMMFKKIIGKVI